MNTDDVGAWLAGVRTQAEDHPLVPSGDVCRLLDAVEAALKVAGRALVVMRDPDGEPMYWDLRPEDLREAVRAELLPPEDDVTEEGAS